MTKQEALEKAIMGLEDMVAGKYKPEVETDPFFKPMNTSGLRLYGHSGYYMSNGKMYRKYISYKGR